MKCFNVKTLKLFLSEHLFEHPNSMSLGQDYLFEQPMAEMLREVKICHKWNSVIIYVVQKLFDFHDAQTEKLSRMFELLFSVQWKDTVTRDNQPLS